MSEHKCPSGLYDCGDHPKWLVWLSRYPRNFYVSRPYEADLAGTYRTHEEAMIEAQRLARQDNGRN